MPDGAAAQLRPPHTLTPRAIGLMRRQLRQAQSSWITTFEANDIPDVFDSRDIRLLIAASAPSKGVDGQRSTPLGDRSGARLASGHSPSQVAMTASPSVGVAHVTELPLCRVIVGKHGRAKWAVGHCP